ncbi:MAG TPA: bifunctional 2-C-methyl-D-erythritol 4-phosphate cytidylyltransferase/2-C-methyl-D-erythritol 2,4-cyclodiphosphate synthase [Geminicoccaceae bacterium]|nr:bifunctional 2-C-methyl-D-erythritol 4-phosphate cytidylyltransferase/2-C-methyl-D-erythritol 2,4-cyclodiphosphate synthase [Geminicoccaceae bacterium]
MADCVALIVASGRGQRFGGERPKQYQQLAGRPVLRHCLERFVSHPRIGAVRAVIHPQDRALYDAAAHGLELLEPADGGPTRQESVRRGLESLGSAPPDLVLIHDGVRPLIDAALIDRVLDGLAEEAAVLPALPVTDTLKRVGGDRVLGTVERQGLYRAQTPQGFVYERILAAHRAAAGAELTDDTAVAEAAGLAVAVVEGDEANLKITDPADLARAARLIGSDLQPRTGLGFDVHRLAPGAGLVLLGVRLPEPLRLIGHSDADVGLHALTDALLGTLGAGDIGSHFPPSDARWAGADSALFLGHARQLIDAAGGRIEHVDVTLICERPKIGPHRGAMVARLAELLALPPARVSVKATTTERLGFIGRGEGIAAQAVATVGLPA